MSIQTKKMSMADKMYDQNSKGGKGASPKFKTNSTGKAHGKVPMKTPMSNKHRSGRGKGQGPEQANTKGSFNSGAKYKQG